MTFIVGNNLTTTLVVIYAFLLVLYCRAEKLNTGDAYGFKRATILKLTLSSIFCAVAVISYYLLWHFSHRSNIFYWLQLLIVIALAFALAGDYFLQYIKLDIKKYKTGISFFTVTQILLIANLCILNGVGWKEFVICAGILAVILVLMKVQNWQLGAEKKRVMAYTILLAFMASKAFVTMLREMTVGYVFMAIGAALFLTSDIVLGVWNYKTSRPLHKYLNWVFYFSGTMLIALSISPEYFTSLIY